MEDPSDRLRRDQDRQNRKREHDRYDRRHVIESTRTRTRIGDLTRRIEAEQRRQRSDEALEAMSAGWPEARAAIEHCVSVTPDIQATWLKRFDAIRYTAKSSVCRSLDELENDINAMAGAVSGIAADLRNAAESRQPSALAFPELTWSRGPIPFPELTRRSEPPWRPSQRNRGLPLAGMSPTTLGTTRLADDLQRIHNRIMQLVSVSRKQRFDWLFRLDEIDKRRNSLAGGPSPVDVIEALISDIDLVASSLHVVGSALGYQASKCRMFWRP